MRATLTAILTAILALTDSLLLAQEAPYIEVKLDRNRIYQGESVGYTVAIYNAEKPPAPRLEGFEDFEVESGGEQSLNSSFTQIINGRMTRTERFGRAYFYRLTPRRAGRLTIPAPVAELDGKELRGKPKTLLVVAPQDQDFVLLEITADRNSVYPLQPFTVTLTVWVKDLPGAFSDRNPLSVQRQAPLLALPWVDNLPEGIAAKEGWAGWLGSKEAGRGSAGFRINNIRSSDPFSIFDQPQARFGLSPRRVRRADRSGNQTGYWEYTLSRDFLPQSVGEYTFGPATLKGAFATRVDESGGLIGEDLYAIAEKLPITVKDVPLEGRPETFIGAIGRFEFQAQLNPLKAKVGDPMTLTLTLKGQGTLDLARAPDLERLPGLAERFRIYEATEESREDTLTFTYSLRPLLAGAQEFPALAVSVFDVERERYVTLRSEPLPIEIDESVSLSPREIISGTEGAGPKDIEARKEGIFANVLDLSELRDQKVRPLFWLGLLGAMAAFYAVVALVTNQLRRRLADPALLRRRSAAGRARDTLRQALADLQANRPEAGSEGVRNAFVGLAAGVAGVSEAGLTPREACERLRALGASEPLVRELTRLLESCEGARYGAGLTGQEELMQKPRQLLDGLLRELKASGKLR